MGFFNKTLTIGDLLLIDKSRINRAKDLRVEYIDTVSILKEMSWLDKLKHLFRRGPRLIYYKVVKYRVHSKSGHTYTVLVKVSPGFDERKFYKNRVEVFCSCADFKYRAAYELNKTDNLLKIPATIKHLGVALDQPPTKISTTPCCKHIYACMEHFRNHMKELKIIH